MSNLRSVMSERGETATMTSPIVTPEPVLTPLPLLEVIRRKEAEVKRGLAAEREAAQTALAEAEERARKLVAAA